MTKVKCDFIWFEGSYESDAHKRHYCEFRGEDGYCTKEEIHITTAELTIAACEEYPD